MTSRKLVIYLVAFSLWTSSCATLGGSSEIPPVYDLTLDGATAAEDLETALSLFLAAHWRCEFSDEVRARIPFPPRPWEELARSPRFCLGRLEVKAETLERSDLAYFEVVPVGQSRGAQPEETYVVFASFVGGHWQLSWPTPLGPPLGA